MQSGGTGLPSPAGRADGTWRAEQWPGDTNGDKLRWLTQQLLLAEASVTNWAPLLVAVSATL